MFALKLRISLGIIISCMLWTSPVLADVFMLGHIRFSGDRDAGLYVLSATIPRQSLSLTEIQVPDGCSIIEKRQVNRPQAVQFFYEISCTTPLLGAIKTPWRLDGARFTNDLALPDKTVWNLLPGPMGIDIPLTSTAPVIRSLPVLAKTYLAEGIVHIWIGWDHLLFVLCLCFLLRGRQLIGVITAFTLGHSLTLGLSYFDVLVLPLAPVESLIAFSIILMARQALLPAHKRGQKSAGHTLLVACIFGLLHGLGFASALSELGAATAEKWSALIFFNLGVEIGQIIFVVFLAAIFKVLRPGPIYAPVRTVALGFSGCVAGFWFFERLAAIGSI